MAWLDNYISKNEHGYLMNGKGGIFVDRGDNMVTPIQGDDDPSDLIDITKEEFISKLLEN